MGEGRKEQRGRKMEERLSSIFLLMGAPPRAGYHDPDITELKPRVELRGAEPSSHPIGCNF